MMQSQQGKTYLQQSMDKQAFIQILTSLYKDFAVNNVNIFAEAFDKIMQANKVVIGSDLYTFAKCLKQQGNKPVITAILSIQDRIAQLQKKGVKAIKREQFYTVFSTQDSNNLEIIELMHNKVPEGQYLSLEKLSKMLKDTRNTYENVGEIQFNQGIDIKKSQLNFDDNQQQKLFESLAELFQQYCLDLMALQKANELIESAKHSFLRIKQELSGFNQNQRHLKTQIQSIQTQCYQKSVVLKQQNQKIEILLDKISTSNQEKQKLQKEISELKVKNDDLQYQKQLIRQQCNRIQIKCTESQQKMRAFLQDRNTVVAQFNDFVKQYQEQKQKQEQVQQNKIFTQRTLKQKLQDANLRIDRLMKQKISMQQQFQQAQQAYLNKLNQFQAQIDQFQRKRIKDSSINRLQFSYISNSTQRKYVPSHLDKFSQYSVGKLNQEKERSEQDSKYSHNQSDGQTVLVQDQIDKQNALKKQQNVKKIAQKMCSSHFDAFKKKKIDQSIFDNLVPGNTQEKTLQQEIFDDYLGLSEQTQQNSIANFVKKINNNQSKKGIFSSQIFIVKPQGNNYEMFIAVNSQKLYLLDTKYREKESFKFQDLAKLFVCYYNQQWLVLRFKKTTKTEKRQFRDIVISISNRTQLLGFLSKRCSQSLKQTRIIFEKQHNIFIQTQTSSEAVKLSQYAEATNPYRLCYFNSFSIFTVKIDNNSLLNVFSSEYLLIIQSIGILFYEKENPNSHDLSKKSKLQYFLPIVQEMQIAIMQDYKIRIRYSTYNNKQYKIITNSFAISKKLFKDVQEIKKFNLLNKKKKTKICQNLFAKSMIQ